MKYLPVFHTTCSFSAAQIRSRRICPLVCPECGGQLKIVAFLTEADPIQRLLTHIGEPATPPRIAPARAPPDWQEPDFDQTDRTELEQAEPVSEYDKSSGKTICTAIGRLEGGAQGSAP
ncbi:MAG: hypothetical protein Kow0060_01110 [Methylohalobius crimeensis]